MKEIKLTQGKVALVDDEDFESLDQWKWYVSAGGYAVRNSCIKNRRTTIFMHRLIMSTPEGMDTDHRDHNKLNNQKGNLRICTHSQNLMNINKKTVNKYSKFKGICAQTDRNNYRSYRATVSVKGKQLVKTFPFTEQGEKDAAAWYNDTAKNHFGDFANVNKTN